MAQSKFITANCPECGGLINVEVWDSVDAVEEPGQRERILSRAFFEHECEECGEVFGLRSTFLYLDTDYRFMVYMVAEEDKEEEERVVSEISDPKADIVGTLNDFDDAEEAGAYLGRTVIGPDRLIEKIMMLESGYDDRLIEVMKLFVAHQAGAQLGAGGVRDIFFEGTGGEGGGRFVLTLDDGARADVAFPAGMYDSLKDGLWQAVEGSTPEGFAVIDKDWATAVIEELGQSGMFSGTAAM
jgi:hypothetical protein